MKRNHLIALVLAAAVLGTMAYLTSREDSTTAPSRMGELLLQDLPIDQIAAVVMTGSAGTTRVERTEDGWIVPSKYGYAADFAKLQRAVLALSQAKIGHEINVTDSQKADMNITDSADRVRLLDAEGNVLAEVILGAARESEAPAGMPYGGFPSGRFVSADSGETVVVVSDALNDLAAADPGTWLNSEMLSVTGADLASITVSGPDREPVRFVRNEDGKLSLEGLKEGEVFDTTKTYSIEGALNYMRFNDIADPDLTDEELGMVNPVIFKGQAKDGTLYVAKVGGSPEGSEDRYARISVSYVAPDDEAAKDDEDDAALQEREKETLAARSAAEALNAKLAEWTYVIPSYKAESLCKQRADFLKEPEEEAETEGADATPSVEAEAPSGETALQTPAENNDIAEENELEPEDK
jgi:hypothetical protein